MKASILRMGIALALAGVLSCLPALGQTGGSGIQGIVRDASGAIIPGATVTVTDESTGRVIQAVANDAGLYVLRALAAGRYQVKVEVQGFKTGVLNLTLEVGELANGDVTLEIGEIGEVVTVQGQTLRVDTVTNQVAGTITSTQVKSLPLNGRNFLDLAQTQPSVELVDGGTFDPTKNQLTGVAVAGRSGRVTRISVDGIDVSDETVGTTTQNISVDAVQEFQVSQSSYDASTSLASAGAVNIITKSGSNEFHGSGFIYVRDEEVSALPATRTGDAQAVANLDSAEFDREQGGFEVGGPVVKDVLFFFLNYETINQDGSTFVTVPSFPGFNSAVTTPFNDHIGMGRLDGNLTDEITAFARFNHETNDAATGFGGSGLAPFVNQNVTNVFAGGFDVTASRFTHSFRYGHTSFDNEISTNNLGLPEFSGGGTPVSVAVNSRRSFFSGPNRLAPQATYQTDDQYKYDGAWLAGNHTIRYGFEGKFTRVNLFASFFGVGPEVRLTLNDEIRQEIIDRGGDPEDPLEYPVSFAILGNGQGSFTEIPNNRRPMGGVNNTRVAWYVEDNWRIAPNFNLNLGLRWDINTGQVNDDLGLPQELAGLLGAEGIEPVRLDKDNFGPRVGFAWQPFNDSSFVIRGGAGLFYETNIFNNTIFDRTDRLPSGLGFNTVTPPSSSIDDQGRVLVSGQPVNEIDTTAWSGAPLRTVIDQIGQTQRDFQAASAAVPFDPSNPPLVLAEGNTTSLFNQDYDTPYGIQTNIGFERQMGTDWVLSVDYVRNRSVHHNIRHNFNRLFASDTLNVPMAQAAIASALETLEVGSIDEAIAEGASISSFGVSGAFAGVDPNFDNVTMILSSGISSYNALQVRTTATFDQSDMLPFIKGVYMNISYALSRFNGMSTDQDFLPTLRFNDNYLGEQNFGPAGRDRRHQLSAQFFVDLPMGFKTNWNFRLASSLPQNLLVPGGTNGGDDIFFTDFDGDGTTNDFLPGVERGAFGRDISNVEELNAAISQYNSQFAGQLTPAGQALVAAGLFTEEQLVALGATAPEVPLAPAGQVFNDNFFTADLRLAKSFNIGGERVRIEPAVEVFNLFNVANYNVLNDTFQGDLSGSPGSPNGTVQGDRTNLVGLGSGSFSQGIPRSFQFALRVSF